MAGLGGTDFDNAMKTLYLGPLNDTVFHKHVLLNRLEKTNKYVSGNFAYIPLVAARNPAVGARKEPTSSVGAQLPPAGRQTYDKATYKMAMHYGHGSVSGGLRRRSRDAKGAFAEALDTEMKGLMKSLPDDLNRQAWGNGTGRAFSVGANVTAKTTCSAYIGGNFRCRVGDRVHPSTIAAFASGTGNPATGTTISSIEFNKDAGGTASTTYHKVTLAAACTCTAATDVFYFGELSALTDSEGSSFSQEMLGLQALIDDGDIGADDDLAANSAEIAHGTVAAGVGSITRSSNQFWQATVDGNSGTKRPLTQELMMKAWLIATAQNGTEEDSIEFYMDPSMWGTLGQIIAGSRVYTGFVQTVEMGFKYIEFNGAKCFYDRDAPPNQVFCLGMSDIMILTQNGYEFLDDDGNVVRIAGSGTRDAWSFAINRDVQCAISNGRTHVRLRDLDTTIEALGALH